MAQAKPLEELILEETADGYLITIRAEGGETLTVEASVEQLDAIVEALDDMLSDDDAFEDDDLDDEDDDEIEDDD
jgi:hypothetical protein